ncbi:MAG: hypothetical protein V4579_12050 [Pseudomonadota bacterium]
MRVLSSKDQIAAFLQRDDTQADNARADLNTDSLIADRQARRDETRRHNQVSDNTRRRGQDISATRRGPDRRGSGRSAGQSSMPTVSSPAEAMKLTPGTKFRTPDGTIRVRP